MFNSKSFDKEELRKDFRYFLLMVWRFKKLPDPTPTQLDIANYLQHGDKRVIIEAFRGVGKSWITSAFVVWQLFRNPEVKILVVSATKKRSDNFTLFTKSLINEIECLNYLKPRADQRDSVVSFDVAPASPDHSPSVMAASITGQLAGSRADLIVADDVEIPNNSDTQAAREKLSEQVKEFDAVLKPNGRIVYLGTPQCEDSLYNELEKRGYVARVWPARYPSLKKVQEMGTRLAPMFRDKIANDNTLTEGGHNNKGQPTEPSRFDEMDLVEREFSYGAAGFALQFQLDTNLSDAEKYPLKLSNLIIANLNPEKAPSYIAWTNDKRYLDEELPNVGLSGDRYYRPFTVGDDWQPYQGAVMAIDPSGRGQDKTGFAVVKMLHGKMFVTAAGSVRGGYDDKALEELASIARDQKVNQVVIESNFGDGMFTKIFQPVLLQFHKCGLEEVRHSTQKEARIIDTIEPVLSQHRLIVDRQIVLDDYNKRDEHESDEQRKIHRLFYQFTRMTNQRGALKHDDAIDALAMAVNWWTEHMAVNSDSSLEKYRERLKEEQLKEFIQTRTGSSLIVGQKSKPKKGKFMTSRLAR